MFKHANELVKDQPHKQSLTTITTTLTNLDLIRHLVHVVRGPGAEGDLVRDVADGDLAGVREGESHTVWDGLHREVVEDTNGLVARSRGQVF